MRDACRLYGFKIHGQAYKLQQEAAASFKQPMRSSMNVYSPGKMAAN